MNTEFTYFRNTDSSEVAYSFVVTSDKVDEDGQPIVVSEGTNTGYTIPEDWIEIQDTEYNELKDTIEENKKQEFLTKLNEAKERETKMLALLDLDIDLGILNNK